MRRKLGLAFALALCCGWSAATGMVQEEPGKLRVVRAGTLILDPLREPIPQGRLVIQGGQIVAAGTAGEVAEPNGAEIIDLSRFTVLPGLIDTHTHLSVARYSRILRCWNVSSSSCVTGRFC